MALPNETPGVYARFSPPRTWSGVLEGAERATHHLHLVAFPCEKCNGPVILGWIGTREDDIIQRDGYQGSWSTMSLLRFQARKADRFFARTSFSPRRFGMDNRQETRRHRVWR
jgi:hypothetical protein